MIFEQLYSSSKGNLYTVTANNGKRLLLECGVPWKKLQKAIDSRLLNIEGCLLTHEHQDHCKAVKEVMKAGIPVFASAGTFEALGIRGRKAITIPEKVGITSKAFDIYAFLLNHDASEPFGFIIREVNTNEYLLFVPDSSHIKQRFNLPFTIIALECSYDKDVLQQRVDTGDINEELAKRLLTSHMEKSVTIRYLEKFCDLSKCREIHLLHMSGDNIDKRQTAKEVEQRFFIKTIFI